jgi:hypothetical protein
MIYVWIRSYLLRSTELCSQSQTSATAAFRLGTMGIKYYTHFVLTGESVAGSDQEFSGVVEVNQPTEQAFDARDIEALLARNFDLRSGDVRLIDWARLQ